MTESDVKKTNQIFSRFYAALRLDSDSAIELLKKVGVDVSRSKLTAWRSSGKNYAELPAETLALFLEHIEIHAKSPLIRVIAALMQEGEFERTDDDKLSALNELVEISSREYGYTPANLRHECKLAGGREVFAKQHDIPVTTLNKWCHDGSDPENWRDMPVTKWQEIFNKKD